MIYWQNIIVFGLVGLAAGYLLRKAWLRVAGHSKGACGTCNHCEETSADGSQLPKSLPLVQVESQADHPHDGAHGPIDHAAR